MFEFVNKDNSECRNEAGYKLSDINSCNLMKTGCKEPYTGNNVRIL